MTVQDTAHAAPAPNHPAPAPGDGLPGSLVDARRWLREALLSDASQPHAMLPGASGSAAAPLHDLPTGSHPSDDVLGRTGEPIVGHAVGTAEILAALGADLPTQVAAFVAGAATTRLGERIEARFGAEVRAIAEGMRELLRLRHLSADGGHRDPEQLETLRRMLLALGTDIRVVLLRLASRLQTLRWHVASRRSAPEALARETLDVMAPLANRLGVWQLKWELEDLAFRFLQPEQYKAIARRLEEKRVERERFVAAAIETLQRELVRTRIDAVVSGRPKHLYSIHSKMVAKGLAFEQVQDVRAFRVIVPAVRDCYTVLGIVHEHWTPVPGEFDDYIARPKPNGYQSLHTVVTGEDGRPFEVQIRTRAMHEHAEYGVAAHWRYKERAAGARSDGAPLSARGEGAPRRGDGGADAAGAAWGDGRSEGDSNRRIAWARQLLAWQREVGAGLGAGAAAGPDERIYVLTPQARIVELPAGATPVDFAYHVHTSLGHRCRGARVDGHLVPLTTSLRNGQTVEIVAARPGSGPEGPSRDWLNAELGYVRSQRARAKVRQWFNAMDLEREAQAGRVLVEKALQREGRTALAFDELARRLHMATPQELFVAVAKEEVGPRALEEAIRGDAPAPASVGEAPATARRSASRGAAGAGSGVLVVGVGDLMTQLARCCRPVPPDPVGGFVTRGRGVSVHRRDCASFAELARKAPERVIECGWGVPAAGVRRVYPVEVVLRARDRQGLLRDVSDVFARDRINVVAVSTLSRDQVATMGFTVEVADTNELARALAAVREVAGVIQARRR